MSDRTPAPVRKPPRRWPWLALLLALSPVSFAGAVACNFFSALAECGLSDCSGGGLGMRQDARSPVPWRVASGVVLVLPIVLVPSWLRWYVRLPIAVILAGAWTAWHLR